MTRYKVLLPKMKKALWNKAKNEMNNHQYNPMMQKFHSETISSKFPPQFFSI